MRNKPVHNITNWDSLTHKGFPLFSNAWFSIMRRQGKIWETFPGCKREASHIARVSLWLQKMARGSLLLIPQKGPRTIEKKTISVCDKDSWLVNWEEDGEPSPSAPSLTVFFSDRLGNVPLSFQAQYQAETLITLVEMSTWSLPKNNGVASNRPGLLLDFHFHQLLMYEMSSLGKDGWQEWRRWIC